MSSVDFDDPTSSEFKIKLVFPLQETQGFTVQQAHKYAEGLLGAAKYTEIFEGEVEHFSYGEKDGTGFRSEACTWALELIDLELSVWGLSYRFTHETDGVTFAVPAGALLKKVLQGSILLALAKQSVPAPTLLAYPLDELDDDPTLLELGVWQDVGKGTFRRKLVEVLRGRIEKW